MKKAILSYIEWFPMHSSNKYMISKCGRIWDIRNCRLKKFRLYKGYIYFMIGKRRMSLHRELALTFLIGYEKGLVVNHLDGNKLNNNLDNLEWTTPIRNFCHGYDMELFPTTKGKLPRNRYEMALRDRLWETQKPKDGKISCCSPSLSPVP